MIKQSINNTNWKQDEINNLNFEKRDEFVIYQGSHGDKGAELADIILPGSAYTEQDGYFTNLEGKLQKAYKASYPPGESKEDWLIINEIAEFMNNRKLFNDKDELESSMFNYLNLQKEKHSDTKNNEENALLPFKKHPEMILKEKHFAIILLTHSSPILPHCKLEIAAALKCNTSAKCRMQFWSQFQCGPIQ